MAQASTENPGIAGGCYCGALRYAVSQPSLMQGQCHCRPCQHISGGGPQYFMLVRPSGFAWTRGAPAAFTKSDLTAPVTRFFCDTCGTHILTQRPDQKALVLKVGTLDDPSDFAPAFAICHEEAQPFHVVAEQVPTYVGIPR